jgi:serine protease Do
VEGGREYKGMIVGQDRRTGLALVKINGHGMAYLGASEVRRLAPGERVLGLGRSTLGGFSSVAVSDGLVTLAYDERMNTSPFIQTSVPVLPGTGGGPLIRQKTGEFVGVISQQFVPRVGTPVTFATPTKVYLAIAEELREKGRVDRAAIHTQVSLLNSEQALAAGIPAATGVLIHATRSGGPADRAGLERGDIVLAVDGTPATSINAYVQAIGSKKPGTPIVLSVFRRGATLDIRVIGELAP